MCFTTIYDLKIRVNVSIFPAMSLEPGRLRLRKKWKEILDDLDPREVGDELYQDKFITQDDLEMVYNVDGAARKKRCRHLLMTLFLANDPCAIPRFFQCLEEKSYDHLCCGISQNETCGGDAEEVQLNETLRESELVEISLAIAHVWKDVGILAGGLSLKDIDSIEYSNPNPSSRPMKMLLRWRANAGEKKLGVQPLTRDAVNAVLEDVDCDDRV